MYLHTKVRVRLVGLMNEKCPGMDWTSITGQVGMFWFSGLTRDQGLELGTRHVYMMPSNGRMSLCGLNAGNVEYFADALAAVCSRDDDE